MHTPLAVGITLLLSFVSGIAVWGEERTTTKPRHAATAVANETPRAAALVDLAKTMVRLCDDAQHARAVLARTAGPAVMMRAAAEPRQLGSQRGLPWSEMDESQRAVAWWMLRAAGADPASIAPPELDEISFACAGDLIGSGDAYVRLHGASFVVECARHGGVVDAVCRDFVRDARAPWLRDRVAQ